MASIVKQSFQESIEVKQKVISDDVLVVNIEKAADEIAKALGNGGKLVICGNGGSESDSLHFAGEIVGRFQKEREPWPAVVLGADPATMTAIANDYGYEEAYARQARAFVNSGDVFIGISTSGNSKNIVRALERIKGRDCVRIGLLGRDGGKIKAMVDIPIVIPSDNTARIQESHITTIHSICEIVEEKLCNL